MRRLRVVGGVSVAAAAAGVLAALASGSGTTAPPSAIAGRALPGHYRLLLTETSDHGRDHVARYGPPSLSDWYDGPLAVESFRVTGNPQHELDAQDGDRATTVRGHPAAMRTLTDEEQPYARELVWRERPDLVVSVTGDFVVHKAALRRVAENVQIIGQGAWARLFEQTSSSAQIGHVSSKMRRLRVERGTVGGHRWTLFALIPPHFPLSRDDRRAACFELRFRGRRGHGPDCGVIDNWQRIGGTVFLFGAVPPSIRHLVIRPTMGHGFEIRTRTVAPRRGPRARYYATALPDQACAVIIARGTDAHGDGFDVAGPVEGRHHRRCARKAR